MKHPVSDTLVAEYTRQLRSGGPVGAIFPQPLSNCDFNEAQKFLIKEARKARKKLIASGKPPPAKPTQPPAKPSAVKPTSPSLIKPKPVTAKAAVTIREPASRAASLGLLEKLFYPAATQPAPAISKTAAPKPNPITPAPTPPAPSKHLTRLEKLLYLQQGKCFFCGETLALEDANIEHLHPVSLGGKGTADNLVACHKTLNDTFGDLPLKQKFEFVLRSAGSFRCPKK